MADCSKGGFQPPEMHNYQQWTAEYVGSLAAWMTTTGDGGGWNQRQALDVVRKIPWQQTVQASVDEHSQVEVDALPPARACK